MERLMQYVWQHRLFPASRLRTVCGRPVSVIDPGRINTAPGPDFFNAKLMIDGRLWAGDIEIHVKASDWFRHGHHTDPAYSSVILHVVDRDDAPVHRANGEIIPQLVLPCSPQFGEHYRLLTDRAPGPVLACRDTVSHIPSLYLTDWLSALALERLHEKADRITALLARYAGDWDQTAFVTLARALGFGINAEPFELLAMSLPLKLLLRHCDSVLSVEAILFGQSGLLDSAPPDDPYVSRLTAEYRFLAGKYGLHPPQGMRWKMGGIRPGAFPHRRIALLAAMICGGFRLISQILHAAGEQSVARIFDLPLSGYWARRYTFGSESSSAPSSLSVASVRTLMINVVAPLTVAFGRSRGDAGATPRAVEFLESIPPERNSVVSLFSGAGVKVPDALTSQALIQLRRAYCEPRKCLFCRIGHRMLASKALRNK